MKRVFASRVVLILSGTGLLLLPRLAIADTGIPMLALAWPVAWCLLPAVILSEAYFARRELGLAWGASVRLSAIANLISTFAGIPLILALVVVVGSTADALNLQSHVWRVLLFPFESLRTKPTGLNPFGRCICPVPYSAFLSAPFLFGSRLVSACVASVPSALPPSGVGVFAPTPLRTLSLLAPS